ncbi:hypothetical protein WNZ15_16605 [Roseibium sp. AS2]|uniref:peptidoglycan-binding domain-containing protein n=1 Tax=Roseibium sp. AS2 TaxID=3135781 RepID=UPI003175A1C8
MINSSIGIVGSVGRWGKNGKPDVVAIQTRLNELMGASRPNLVPDGISGRKTRGMIADFQVSVVGFRSPDSRVDPVGRTIIALNDPASASVWQRMSIPDVPNEDDPHDKPSGKPEDDPKPARRPTMVPRALTDKEIAATRPGGFLRWIDPPSPGGVAVAKAGDVWLAPEGKRQIIHALEYETLQDGKLKPSGIITYQQLTSDTATAKEGVIYRQNREGFVTDILYAGVAHAGKNLQSTKVLIEAEMEFLLAIASANPVVFAADAGLKVAEWTAKNKDSFPKWANAIKLVLAARTILKTYTPTLWDKIVDAALFAAWKGSKAAVAMFGADVARNIPEGMVSDPKKIIKLAGSLLGAIGKSGFNARMTALRMVWAILSTVAVKALTAVPAAIKITAVEKKKAALDLVASLKAAGVALSEKDAETIVEEVARNADKVEEALKKLKAGYEAIR